MSMLTKTEHHQGKSERVVPIFPELVDMLAHRIEQDVPRHTDCAGLSDGRTRQARQERPTNAQSVPRAHAFTDEH